MAFGGPFTLYQRSLYVNIDPSILTMTSAGSQPATAGNPQSHPYTCNTCQVAYRSIELQKGHMKSDWQYVISAGVRTLDLGLTQT